MKKNNSNKSKMYCIAKNYLYYFILIFSVNLNLTANDNLGSNHNNIADHFIELIVFKYLDETSIGTEIFERKVISNYERVGDQNSIDTTITSQSLLKDNSIIEVLEKINAIQLNEIPADKNILFKLAPRESWTLENIYNRLDRIKVYQPIIWNGWYQSLNKEDSSQIVSIRRLKNTLGLLEGNLRLYESKRGKLRLALDMSMLEENTYQPESKEISNLENTNTSLESITELIRYPFSDDKEMKINELRYFDHPKFGIIAKVTKITPPASNVEMKTAKINPLKGNVFDQELPINSQQYVSSIERGIVGLAKTGKYVSLTLNRDGDYEIHVADQLAIEKLKHSEVKNDRFSYTASNGKNNVKRQLNVQVTGVNDPPTSMDKIIIYDNLSPYSFSVNDFYFDDAEGDVLNYVILTDLPSKGKIYLEYPFGIWHLNNNMQIDYQEISHLKYQGTTIDENESAPSIKFRVSDGQVTSDYEYSIIFQKPTLGELKAEGTQNNLLPPKDKLDEPTH